MREPGVGLSLRDALSLVNGEVLKRLAYRCGARGKDVPTRREDAIDMLAEQLLTPSFVHGLLATASQLELTALSEAAHGDGSLNPGRFSAKYDVPIRLPDLSIYQYGPISNAERMTLLDVFFFRGRLPWDVQPILRRLISKPPEFAIKTATDLPAAVPLRKQSGSPTGVEIETHRVETSAAALPDLLATLALARDGRLAITAKSEVPTAVTLRQLATHFLLPGVMSPGSIAAEDDGIREFALSLMIRSAGLAAASGSKLLLTDEGRRALGSPNVAILKRLWDAWIAEDSFDELSRVNGIKGQRASRTLLSKPSSRKHAIARALATCPTDGWIAVDDFLDHVRINGCDFEVELGHESGLYVGYSYETGWLGYSHRDYWQIVQTSYVRTILMEYAATLGVVDFATVSPEEGFTGLSYDDYGDDSYLSRYDGITHIRIGPLGRYILGLDATYDGPPLLSGARALVVLPSLDVIVADRASILPWERAALERFASRASEDVYRLSKESLLDAVEEGASLADAEEFFRQRSREPLPQTVVVVFADVARAAAAVAGVGTALLVRCVEEHVAQQLASHSATRKYCLLAANAHVVVPAEHIEMFRRGVKRLGFVLLGEREIVAPAKAKTRRA